MIRRAAIAAGTFALLAGCGGTDVDIAGIETEIQSGFLDQTHARVTVDCPDEIDWKVGSEFHCIATSSITSETVKVTVSMENDDGDYTWSTD